MRAALGNALLVLASACFGVVLVEIALRITGVAYPLFHQYDALRGSALRPGASGWYRNEGRGFVRVSHDGLRDVEHAREKPPGHFRIALIGDSFAEALQVDVADTFWKRMERVLSGCGALAGKTVEIINFGASGYSAAQEYLTQREHAMAYSPDVVLVLFVPANDGRDSIRGPEKESMRPTFAYADGRLVLDDSFRHGRRFRRGTSAPVRALHALNNHVRVISVLHELWVRFRDGAFRPDATTDPMFRAELYRAPVEPLQLEGWRVAEALLSAMADEARRGGARFVVTSTTTPIQVHPDPAERARFLAKHPGTDLDFPQAYLRAVGARGGYPVIDIVPSVRAAAERERVLMHGFANATVGIGHWNLDGHRLVGDALAAELCRVLEAPPSPDHAPEHAQDRAPDHAPEHAQEHAQEHAKDHAKDTPR